MKTIIPNQRFLDDRDEYLADTEYDVDDDKAYYFVHNGWANLKEEESSEVMQPSEVDLDIQNAKLGVESQNG